MDCATRLLGRAAHSALAAALAVALPSVAAAQVPGPNVNVISGTSLPHGDPFLQRQNEASGTVSTRNPLHLLAGANDYRTVDIPGILDEEEAKGDAWLGLYKSFDGGQSWRTSLLPGYPQDTSPDGLASPLKGFAAGADAVVRAGTNGLFYYSGMAFNRGEQGLGVVFVSRFIDNNNLPGADPIAFLGTKAVRRGTSGQFIDKPTIVVDVPRAGAATCTIQAPGVKNPQKVPAGDIYLAYVVFTGSSVNNPHAKLMVSGHPTAASPGATTPRSARVFTRRKA